jgi:Xaa-Pro aminopeptidase
MDTDDTKLYAIREVLEAAEEAMAEVIKHLQTTPLPTSEDAHAIIDSVLERYDCDSPEGHIVSSGLQSHEPHEKGAGVIRGNVPIVIDIYPRSRRTGFYADITRTVCLGVPTKKLSHMYKTVLQAQETALRILGPGKNCKEIHVGIREYFEKAHYVTSGKGKEFPFAEGFVHSTGHGVSRTLHDVPIIGSKSSNVLKVGDIVTIEPGLYYKKYGGIRIEDMVLITPSGYEVLSKFPKTFSI